MMDNLEKKLENYVKKTMYYQDIPGISVVITNKNQVIYSKGFGFTNINSKEPITEKTIFHMASITKLFVTIAIMQLVDKGKIKLDDNISYYLPGFSMKDNRYKDITVFQLLNHTSGIPDCTDYGWEQPEYDDHALSRYVYNLQDIHLLFPPGDKFQYSNIAFEILGYLIEVVNGKVFETYIEKHILEPLGMQDSTLLYRGKHCKEIAAPHTKNKEKEVVISNIFPYNRIHAPSSTLTSNAVDMGKWAMANINRGIYKGQRILPEDSYEKMWTATASIRENQEKMGLGWFLSKHRSYDMLGHDGNDVGFRTSFGMIPEKDLSIGVFANIDNISTRRMMRSIFDILLEVIDKNHKG